MDVAPPASSDDLRVLIQSAQADLALAAEVPSMRNEPFRLILAGLSGTLAVFGKSITRWERAVADVIAAHDPLTEEDRVAIIAATEEGAYRGVRQETKRMVRTLDRGTAVKVGLWVGGAYVLGAVSVVGFLAIEKLGPYSPPAESLAAWHDLMRNNPDPRPAIASAEIRADHSGRRYYSGISLWIDPAKPPSAGQ